MPIPFYISSSRDLLQKAREFDLPMLQHSINTQDRLCVGYSLFNFAASAHHVADWLKQESKAGATFTTGDVEQWVNQHQSLAVCRDLANGNKHREIEWRKQRRIVVETLASLAPVLDLTSLELSHGKPPPFRIKIPLVDGSRLDALDVASRALADWARFLSKHGL